MPAFYTTMYIIFFKYSLVLNFQYEKLPSTSWKLSELQQWLAQKGIEYLPKATKKQLIAICALFKKNTKKLFLLDEYVAKNTPHRILRLPHYHCFYNAIEYAWGIAKAHYDKNIGYKQHYGDLETKEMWQESLARVTPDTWNRIVDKVERKMIRHYNRYVLQLTIEQRENGDGLHEFPSSSACSVASSGSEAERQMLYDELKEVQSIMDEVNT